MSALTRRGLLATGGLATAVAAAAPPPPAADGPFAWRDGDGRPPALAERTQEGFLTAEERAFLIAAADRIIPADATGPSASEAGVVVFIDRQLAGPYGRGEHLFLGGPWFEGTLSQGPQLRLAPGPFLRLAMGEIADWIAASQGGARFADLQSAAQDAALRDLEAGRAPLKTASGAAAFAVLLDLVREGYFADPLYGGNRGMKAWAMIGFPGARYDYTDWVDRHGAVVSGPPVGLVEGLAGRAG